MMLRDMHLLERSVELDVLMEMLAFVRSTGRGHLVVIGGEAGIGKSALVHEFCALVGPRRARTLYGACEALQTPRPLGPLLDIAADVGGPLAAAVAAEPAPADMLAALVEELKRRAPSIVVLEDLHWSDEATLDFLRLLARRVGGVPALVVATYREDALARHHPLRVALGDLSPTALTRLSLAPLSLESVAALAQPYGVDAAELHVRTGGNPFYVTEALAAGGATVPDSVRDAVLARAARLTPCGQRVLDAVSIAPPRVELWLLQRLVGSDLANLEECLASGILRAHGPAVGFRHEMARVAIAEALPPDRALELHREALAALAAVPNVDSARLAHHADAAGDGGAVLRFARAAGDRAAALGSHREAAAQYGRALRFADALPSPERAALLEQRSYECYLTADIDGAIEARELALAEHRASGDRRREGDAHRWLSRLWWYSGDRANADGSAAAAVELLEQLPPGAELAMAYSGMAQLQMLAGDVDATREWAERARALAAEVGVPYVAVHALNNVGTAELATGDEAGIEKVERSLAMARAGGFADEVARAYTNLAAMLLARRRFAQGERYLDEGLAFCADNEFDAYLLYLSGLRARAQLDQGRWEDALDTATAVLDDPCTAPPSRIVPLTVVGLVHARTGDGDPWPALDEAYALAVRANEIQRLGPVAAARVEARWLAGNGGDALSELDSALELALARDDEWTVGELLVWRRRIAAVDDPAVDRAADPFRLELEGRSAAAAARWRKLGSPYEEALALLDADDEPSLRSSLEALQALAARPAASRAARLLRERGVRDLARGPRAATRRNPAGLTARELEVLSLVAQGLRNAHIADKLVVSAKTVDHHVSAILRKLNAGSRTEAAAHATRLGLLER